MKIQSASILGRACKTFFDAPLKNGCEFLMGAVALAAFAALVLPILLFGAYLSGLIVSVFLNPEFNVLDKSWDNTGMVLLLGMSVWAAVAAVFLVLGVLGAALQGSFASVGLPEVEDLAK